MGCPPCCVRAALVSPPPPPGPDPSPNTHQVRGISASGVVDAADVLRVSPLTECHPRGAPSCDIDHFLAARTAAGRPALVLVEQVASVGSDAAFDRAIAPLERLVEPTLNQPVPCPPPPRS